LTRKRLLTEHLDLIILNNEREKSVKLEQLMDKLRVEDPQTFSRHFEGGRYARSSDGGSDVGHSDAGHSHQQQHQQSRNTGSTVPSSTAVNINGGRPRLAVPSALSRSRPDVGLSYGDSPLHREPETPPEPAFKGFTQDEVQTFSL